MILQKELMVDRESQVFIGCDVQVAMDMFEGARGWAVMIELVAWRASGSSL